MMELKTIIFNSELEFRQYVILNSKLISHIVVFDDTLDNTIFFYCFFKGGILVAAKEISANNFITYRKVYQNLATTLKLWIDLNFQQLAAFRLIK